MVKFVLLTRPKDRNAEFIKNFGSPKIKYILEPMLTIKPLNINLQNTNEYKHLIFTSKYGVEYFFKRQPKLDSPKIYCVGNRTQAELLKFNIDNIKYTASNSAELQNYLNNQKNKNSKEFLHISGKDIAHNFKINDILCNRAILYSAVTIDKFSQNLIKFINKIDIILFFSARTADNFCRLIIKYSLENECKNIYALCISTRTANMVKNIKWADIYISKTPNSCSLANYLDKIVNIK